MIGAKTVKQFALSLGADLCGIAPAERFKDAPEGFRPEDIYPDCRAVVVFAKQIPVSTLGTGNSVLYTHVHDMMAAEIDWIGVELSLKLESHGMGAVPIPSEKPYDPGTDGHPGGWGVLSLRHAGWLAGLGVLGRSTLLVNRDFGSMIHLGGVLVDAALEGDPMASYVTCRPNCRACIEACPGEALDGTGVDHARCREQSQLRTPGGSVLWRCSKCREVCPNHLGM